MTKKTKLAVAEEKYRVSLYRTCEGLLEEAASQARKGKPTLLRILTRAAGRARKAARPDKLAGTDEWDQDEINRQLEEVFGKRHKDNPPNPS